MTAGRYQPTLETTMNMSCKSLAIRTLAVSFLAAAAMGSANARVILYRTAVVVAPVVAVPVVVRPIVPAVEAPVYVPTCRLVSLPFVNALTGVAYLTSRQVCN
jgi:hypothetical protein